MRRFATSRAALLACFALIAFSAPAAAAQADGYEPSTAAASEWLAGASDQDAVLEAVTANSHKLPVEFEERLKWADSDGTLQVMVTLHRRDGAVERVIKTNTSKLAWYGDDPRFLARVSPDQLGTLLHARVVVFVEPDYPVTNFMSAAAMDVRARSTDDTGVYTFDATGGPMGALVSNVSGLTPEQVTGDGVRVAITDSGIDKTHRDFGGFDCEAGPYHPCESRVAHAAATEHLIGFETFDALPTTEAASGHGTHVAGTIAGNGYYTRDDEPDAARYGGDGYVIGIAPNADLVSVKNGDSQSAGFSTAALQWQLDHAAELGIRVSSNSWGCLSGCSFNPNSVTSQVVRDLYLAGVVTTFAVGNDGGGPDGSEFSGYAQSPYVLGVAAYNDENDRLASFSSRGKAGEPMPDPESWSAQSEPESGYRRPDVAAPGVGIWSARTLTGGTSSLLPRTYTGDVTRGGGSGIVPYVTMSGTSMATPHVAGAAAVLFGACPAATNLDVMRSLLAGANETKVLKTSGPDLAEPFEVGYGGLDVRAALDRLLGIPDCGGDQPWSGSDPDPTPSPDPTPEPEPTAAPALPSDEDAAIVDPFGDANYVNDQGAGGFTGHVGEESTPADAGAVADLGKVWFTNTDSSISVHVQTETKGPATVGYFYRVQVDPGSGTRCLSFQAATAGAGNVRGNEASLRDTCENPLPTSSGRISFFDGPDGTGIMSLTFPLSAHPALEMGKVLASPTAHSRNFAGIVTAPQIDNTIAGKDYEVAAPEPVATAVAFAEGSATSGQYSDEASVTARVTDAATNPIEGAEVTFDLSGDDGTGSWTVVTDAGGVASATINLTLRPGTYELTARYAGEEDRYAASDAVSDFVIEKEDTICSLSVSGQGANKLLAATLADEDSGAGIAGRAIEFFADGEVIGTSETDVNGQASHEVPPRYRGANVTYDARFVGDEYFVGSSDQAEGPRGQP